MRTRFTSCGLIVVLLLAFSAQLLGQTEVAGDITGTVTDPTGAVVAGASVTATSLAEGAEQTTTTNSAGFFRFSFLKPGGYKIRIAAKGFKAVLKTVQVNVGQVVAVNQKLELGSEGVTIEVTSSVPLIQTENADIQTSYSQAQIEQLPAPGGDTTSYAYTAPGVTVSNGAGYGNFSSFGLPSTSNLFTVNGNDNMDPFLNLNNSGASNLTLGANELQEISIVNNGYTAQYGRQAGAQVNSVTKSGSNSLHGNLYFDYNSNGLNANDWFNNAANAKRAKAISRAFGGSVGGPIVKNKLFFFVDYEALRLLLPGVSGPVIAPSPQFASFVQGNVPAADQSFYQTIFKLYAGAPGIGSATPVAGGGCGDYDGVNGFGAAGLPCAVQFTSGANNVIPEWILAGRVDYKINPGDSLFIHYHMDRGTQATGTDPINAVFNSQSIQPEYDGQLTETHVFNGTTINNFIFSAQWYKALFGPPSFSKAIATFPTTLAFGNTAPGFAALGGADNAYPQGRIPTQYQITDDFSKIIGGHDIKVGLNFRRDLVGDYSSLAGTSGLLTVNSATEFANGLTNGSGSNASFYSAAFTNTGAVKVKYYSLGAYAQDQWKVTSKLNVTLALRVDRNSNPVCSGCFVRMQAPFQSVSHDVNLPYNTTIKTGLSSAFPSVDKVVFSPRMGFAYNIRPNTVIRGGFGIFDDLFPAVLVDRFITNAPTVNTFLSNQSTAGEFLAPGTGGVFADAAASNTAFQNGFSTGGTLASLQAVNPNFNGFPYYTVGNKVHNPKFAEWNLEWQEQLNSKVSLGVNYVGNHGYDILGINTYLNSYCAACAPGQSFGGIIGTTPADSRFLEVVDLNNDGYSNYAGLTASVKLKPLHGLQGQFNYTWSHDLDTCSNDCLLPFVANTLVSIRYQTSPTLPGSAYGNSDYDVRHNYNMNYIYNIPSNWTNPALKHIAGGWTIAGTLFGHTGIPWSPVDSAKRGQLGNVTGLRTTTPLATYAGSTAPTFSCGRGAAQSGAGIGGAPCATIAQFTVGANNFGFGRNSQHGPSFFDTDLALTKEFKVGERFGVAIGATAFNILNHQNFDLPVNSIRSPLFGQIFSTVGTNTSPYGAFFGVPINGRILEITGKVTF